MKTKKILAYFGVMVIGAVLTASIDHLIGINLDGVSAGARFIHNIAYIFWGAAIYGIVRWPNE